jgi:hypothetical protein
LSRLGLKSPSFAMLDCSRAKKYMDEKGEKQDSVHLCQRHLGNQGFENTDVLISSTISANGKTRSRREN